MVNRSWLSPKLLANAFRLSFSKFDPRYVARNPVVFMLYLCFVVSALMAFFPSAFRGVEGTMLGRSDYFVISAILLLTIWFSFLSEALAEAQGRAQADSLRRMKKEILARVVVPDGAIVETSSTMLKRGDAVLLRAGDLVPSDGSITHGSLLLDESMINFHVAKEEIAQKRHVKCEVRKFDLSAHADHKELLSFVKACDPQTIVLMHSDDREPLAKDLREDYKVLLPKSGEEFEF